MSRLKVNFIQFADRATVLKQGTIDAKGLAIQEIIPDDHTKPFLVIPELAVIISVSIGIRRDFPISVELYSCDGLEEELVGRTDDKVTSSRQYGSMTGAVNFKDLLVRKGILRADILLGERWVHSEFVGCGIPLPRSTSAYRRNRLRFIARRLKNQIFNRSKYEGRSTID